MLTLLEAALATAIASEKKSLQIGEALVVSVMALMTHSISSLRPMRLHSVPYTYVLQIRMRISSIGTKCAYCLSIPSRDGGPIVLGLCQSFLCHVFVAFWRGSSKTGLFQGLFCLGCACSLPHEKFIVMLL